MSTLTEALASERWADYFALLTPKVEGFSTTIEVMRGESGDQVSVEGAPLQTIGYDRKDDVLEVAVGGNEPALRHFIAGPTEISIEGSDEFTPSAILVTDSSGCRTLIRLRQRAALGAQA